MQRGTVSNCCDAMRKARRIAHLGQVLVLFENFLDLFDVAFKAETL